MRTTSAIDDDDDDHDVRAGEIRDPLERLRREMRCVIDLPLAYAVVDLHELGVGPHEVGEQSEHETASDGGCERDRQRETCCGRGVKTAAESPRQPRMANRFLPELPSCSLRGSLADHRSRKSASHQVHEGSRDHRDEQEDQNRHL